MRSVQIPKNCPICGKDKISKPIQQYKRNGADFTLFECCYCNAQFWEPFKGAGKEWFEENNALSRIDILKPAIKRSHHKEFLKRHKDLPIDTKIIDFGCGTGELIGVLRKKGYDAWGVDQDGGAVKTFKKFFGDKNIYEMPLEEFLLMHREEKFDIITFFEVFQQLDNPLEFIKSLERLLKPNGKIILSTPSRNRLLLNLASWDFPPHHLSRWNKEAVSNLFKNINFEISYLKHINEFNLILEAVNEKFRTGLVNKISKNIAETPKNVLFIKNFYILARAKEYILGTIPSIFLFLWAKINGFHGGAMYIELKKIEQK